MCSIQHCVLVGALEKDEGKYYSFDSFCGLLIRAHEKFIYEGKLEFKQ
jgi:hypothetical protein